MDINFLSEKKEDKEESKDKDHSKSKIEWSKSSNSESNSESKKPIKEKKANIGSFLSKFFNFNFLNKKSDLIGAKADKIGLKKSRKEVLKFISNQNKESNVSRKKKKSIIERFFSSKKKVKSKNNEDSNIILDHNEDGKATLNHKDETLDNHKELKKENKEDSSQYQTKKWEAPQILETNLIKNDIIIFYDWQKKIIILLIVVVLSCIMIGVAYFGLFWIEEKKEAEEQYIIKNIEKVKDDIVIAEKNVSDALEFKKKLNQVSTLLDKHVYWSNFFAFLEKNTLSDVNYISFSGDIKGNYGLPASAKSFNLIDAQVIQMLSDDHVIGASVREGSIDAEQKEKSAGVNFKINLSLNPKIFTE